MMGEKEAQALRESIHAQWVELELVWPKRTHEFTEEKREKLISRIRQLIETFESLKGELAESTWL